MAVNTDEDDGPLNTCKFIKCTSWSTENVKEYTHIHGSLLKRDRYTDVNGCPSKMCQFTFDENNSTKS